MYLKKNLTCPSIKCKSQSRGGGGGEGQDFTYYSKGKPIKWITENQTHKIVLNISSVPSGEKNNPLH